VKLLIKVVKVLSVFSSSYTEPTALGIVGKRLNNLGLMFFIQRF